MKAILKIRKGRKDEWTVSPCTTPFVRITPKRVLVGAKYPSKFDRFTGKCLDAWNPHIRARVLMRVEDDNGVILLVTTAGGNLISPGKLKEVGNA